MEYDYLVNIYIAGDYDSGKTALGLRFAKNEYTFSKTNQYRHDGLYGQICLNDKQVKIRIWDCYTYHNKMRGVNGVIITCDLTNQDALKTIGKHIEFVQENAAENTPIILVGTKSDSADIKISEEQLATFARSQGLDSIVCSALIRTNIDETFKHICGKVLGPIAFKSEQTILAKNQDNLEHLKQLFFRAHSRVFTNSKSGFFSCLRRTNVNPQWNLDDILKHALNKNRSRDVCVALRWITPQGLVLNTAPEEVKKSFLRALTDSTSPHASSGSAAKKC